MEAKKSDFKFNGYLIRYSEIKQDETILDGSALKIKIDPSGIKNGKDFILTLKVSLHDEQHKLEVNIEVDGYFSFREEIEEIPPYFTLNAPAILFPYIRAYVSLLTSLSGKGTVNLPTLNLSGLTKELKNNIKDENK